MVADSEEGRQIERINIRRSASVGQAAAESQEQCTADAKEIGTDKETNGEREQTKNSESQTKNVGATDDVV